MNAHASPTQPEASRARRLKAATFAAHGEVDAAIMAANPFADVDRYARFLELQYAFHRDIDALYRDGRLDAVLTGLDARRRLPQIVEDLADLGRPEPTVVEAPAFAEGEPYDLAAAVGWLYVAEGSNLGAAILLKEAAKIGLSAGHGARHLAPAPEGRAISWRAFAAALDQVALDEPGERRADAAALSAFACVRLLVDRHFEG